MLTQPVNDGIMLTRHAEFRARSAAVLMCSTAARPRQGWALEKVQAKFVQSGLTDLPTRHNDNVIFVVVIFGRLAWSDAISVAKTAPPHGRTPGAC